MPRDLETICLKALQKDPAAALSRRRGPGRGSPAIPRRRADRRPSRLRPRAGLAWCRRNPRVASLAATVALLLIVMAIGSTAAYLVLRQTNRELVAANITAKNRRIEAEIAQKRAEEEKKLAVAAGRAAIQQNREVVEAQREMILKLEDKWRNVPALTEVRRDVLGLAIRILESAAEHDDRAAVGDRLAEPRTKSSTGGRSDLAHQRIGEVRMADNQLAEANKEFRINNEICERVAAANPENLEHQNRLVKSCRQLGAFAQHSLADSKEAMRQYKRALEIARKCVAKRAG